MDASKFINGSGTVPLAKSDQPNAVRSEAKKVDKGPTGKTAKTERPKVKAISKSKSEKLVCRYAVARTWRPASSSGAIADAANASASAVGL